MTAMTTIESTKKSMSQYMYDLMFNGYYVKDSDDSHMIIESKKDYGWTHDISRFTVTLTDAGINVVRRDYTINLWNQEELIKVSSNNDCTVAYNDVPLFVKNLICNA